MNEVQQILRRARSNGVQLWTVDGRLRYRPTGGLDPGLAAELRRHRAQIIELLLAEQLTLSTPLQQVGHSTSSPLSYHQEGLWFLEELDLPGPSYNMLIPIRVEGALDVDALRTAVREIVRRHEILRTRFSVVDGVPAQVVADEALRFGVTEADDPGEIWRKHVAHRFDRESERLFWVEVVRLGPERHLVILDIHHLLFDGASCAIFFQELHRLYDAHTHGRPSPLPELQAQYADFAVWQRERADGDRAFAYWKKRLAGASSNLELPLDHPCPQIPDLKGAHCAFTISREVMERLTALGAAHNATLPMVLFAAYGALLSRWTGQTDISVGMPIDSRVHPDAQGLIGNFLNTVVIRVDLGGDLTFAELLGQARTALLEAYEHRDLPFHRLVAELAPDRGGGWSQPMFQAMFSHRLKDRPRLGDLDLTVLDLDGPTAKFELTLFAAETPDGIDCSLEYATALFEAETMERLAARYRRLLDAVLARPDLLIAELPLLTEPERRRLLRTWNATAVDLDTDRCLHEPFETMADEHPDRTAVVFDGRSLSYGELDARANQVAHRLRAHGAGPERPVAVRMDRSLDLLPCLLGVLKAGAPYVPIDPDHPAERQEFMLADSGAAVLLSQRGPSHLPPGVRKLSPDADEWPTHRPPPLAAPDNLAYIIYTSGSTGRPKGVGVSHRATLNRIEAMQRAYRLGPADAVLQKTPITFDVSVWELFWTLAGGARLVLAAPGGHRDPGYLRRLINREKVSTVHFVPSMLTAFLADDDAEDCPGLRRVICSGEELPVALADRFIESFGCDLINQYGPTEAAIDCSAWLCGKETGRVPIGRPTPNVRLYVLDDRMRPVPIGATGELHIAGVQLARGYHDRPDLTAASFVPDPYGPPGSRLYRTGDLARVRADGAIEFLGRLDDQVKIRGYRVELGEIESVTRQCPGVRETAVVVRDRAPGDRQLVAYVVGTDDVEGVRRHLRRRIPDHMVPSAIVPLDALPLTSSGKLHRKALPAPRFGTSDVVAPRTAREAAIAEIWDEVLDAGPIGVLDDFFALGGHSLLATRVIAGMRRRIGVDVPLQEFYARPTIADLAALSHDHTPAAEAGWLVPLTPPGRFVVFVLPAAGMGPSAFRAWRDVAPDGVEVVAVNLPGRERRFGETPMTHVDPLAVRLAEVIDGYGDRPYAIFGHSAGALVAREVARRVRRRPTLLAVAGSHSPDRASGAGDPTDEELLGNLVRWGHVAPEVLADPSHPSILLPPLRGDLAVAASCRKSLGPAEVLDVPLIVFAGRDDENVSSHDCLSWRDWTSGRFEIRPVDGDHFFPLAMGDHLMSAIVHEAARVPVP
jgi:amino acid adenylation domain-containing protein